jgi:hypothetical protein
MSDAHFMRLARRGGHQRTDDLQPFDAKQFAGAMFGD